MRFKQSRSSIIQGIRVFLLLAGATLPTNNLRAAPNANEFNDRVNEVVNGVTIFTSQDTASSGVFSFDSDTPGVGDADIDLIKLPGKYTFGDENDVLRPQIRGVLGSLESKRSVATGSPGSIDDFSRLEVLTAGVFGGVVYRPWRELRITPLIGVAYSHVKRRYDYNNSFSQMNLLPYDREAFNTSVDVMTYSPTVELDYTFREGATVFIPKVRYSHLFNDSVSSKSSVVDVNSDSGMLQSFLDVETPLGYKVYGQDLGLHPFIVRTDLFGTAKEARGPNYFYEAGADLTFTDKDRKLIEGFSLGASYIFGDNFSGYRIGVGLIF
jgi:hypothetical protein